MPLTERNETSCELSTISGQQPSANRQTVELSSIAWANDEDDQNGLRKRKTLSANGAICCGALVGALAAGIAFAVILTILLISKSSTTTKLTTNVNTTTSTVTTVTSTTTTTSTTPDPCLYLRWNRTGEIVAGTGAPGTALDQLDSPRDIYIDSNNILYIVDYGNNRVQKWVLGASTGSTIAGRSNGATGSGPNALKDPVDLTFDKNGYMYVVDQGNHRIQSFAPNSTVGVTVAGTGTAGNTNDRLSDPSGVAVDEFLNLYITDTGNQRIMKWVANATNGTVFISAGIIMQPCGIIVKNGSPNQVYVSDLSQNQVQLWSAGANQANRTLAGVSPGDLDGPTAIQFDLYGNLYVANTAAGDVRKFCASSTTPEIIAGGLTTTPTLSKPAGIAFDTNYNLYISDTGNDCVFKFSRL